LLLPENQASTRVWHRFEEAKLVPNVRFGA
jgi:hypothetical protein